MVQSGIAVAFFFMFPSGSLSVAGLPTGSFPTTVALALSRKRAE